MADFRNKKCVVCNQVFKDQDDIVVCPECGAPYHRKCYEINNKCIYEEVHGTDKCYHSDELNSEENISGEIICPRCNEKNPKNANFCSKCGFILNDINTQNMYNQIKDEIPAMFDPMGGVNPEENMDGVLAGDVAKFVSSNTPYYMSNFEKIKDKKRSRFNFSAFLFSGAWFLYRKQYKIGIILTSIIFLMMISSLFFDYFYSTPILNEVFNAAGVSIVSDFNSANYSKIYLEVSKLTADKKLLLFIPSIIKFIDFLIMIISGIFANKIYYKHCIKKIKDIKQSSTENDYNEKIQKAGGVNLRLMWILFICYMIINFLPNIIMPN